MPRKSTKNGPAGPMVVPAPFPIKVSDLTSVEDFLRTGKHKHDYEGGAIVGDQSGDAFLLRGGEFLGLNRDRSPDNDRIVSECSLEEAGGCRDCALNFSETYVDLPSAVMVSGGPKGWKNTLITCADEDFENIEVKDGTPVASMSFLCLGRFIGDIEPLKLVPMLHSGKIKVLDFTKDETRKVSADDRKKIRANKPEPPELGFTYLSHADVWHRSATVLVRYGRMRILLGQDDGTYFGCELKDAVNTIKEAFKALMPKHIRRIKGVERQGEWFIVPVDEKNVPVVTECAAISEEFDGLEPAISLPVDDEDSARHTVQASDIRIDKNGMIYARGGSLHHSTDDHPDIEFGAGWHTFEHNTAVRSFSQEGVD